MTIWKTRINPLSPNKGSFVYFIKQNKSNLVRTKTLEINSNTKNFDKHVSLGQGSKGNLPRWDFGHKDLVQDY